MEYIIIGVNVILTITLGLFIKNYLPSYMDKKGENLATKEDIQEITRKTEEVQQEFRVGLEEFSSDLQFKYDFYYKQYSELYCKLYAIIIQSEYVRHFINITDNKIVAFEDAPFIEITPTKKTNQKIMFKEGESAKITQSVEEIETDISQFNKKELCDYIIKNGEYATQSLLKNAVAYRFAYSHYSGNKEVNNSSCGESADKEEFRLIREMVICIVKDYNTMRKELKMDFDQKELETGIPTIK